MHGWSYCFFVCRIHFENLVLDYGVFICERFSWVYGRNKTVVNWLSILILLPGPDCGVEIQHLLVETEVNSTFKCQYYGTHCSKCAIWQLFHQYFTVLVAQSSFKFKQEMLLWSTPIHHSSWETLKSQLSLNIRAVNFCEVLEGQLHLYWDIKTWQNSNLY